MLVSDAITALKALNPNDLIAVQWVTKEDIENSIEEELTNDQWEAITDNANYGPADRYSEDIINSTHEDLNN